MENSTQGLREELSKVRPRARCCAWQELLTLLLISGVEPASGEGREPNRWQMISLVGPTLARRVLELSRSLEGLEVHLDRSVHPDEAADSSRSKGRAIQLWVDWSRFQNISSFFSRGWTAVFHECGRRRCCAAAHVRGLVLARGHLVNPRCSYHLEMSLPDDYPVSRLQSLAKTLGFPLHTSIRRGRQILYLKGGDVITELLGTLGAVGQLLRFEEAVTARRMREGINRAVNCEVSNLRRVSQAASAQLEAISYLSRENLLEGQSDALKEAAQLRLAHPTDDLAALAKRLRGVLSRSGLFHRLRRLVEIARAHRRSTTRNRAGEGGGGAARSRGVRTKPTERRFSVAVEGRDGVSLPSKRPCNPRGRGALFTARWHAPGRGRTDEWDAHDFATGEPRDSIKG